MQKTCLIIPFYNEEHRFPVSEFLNYYNRSDKFSFCFVNDGSSDNTLSMLNKLKEGRESRILVLSSERNEGKASAVRRGITESLDWQDFDFVGYMDADLSAPFSQLELLLEKISTMPAFEFVFGSRVKLLGRKIERNAGRHYFGRVFSTFTSLMLKIPVYDTQCGAKIFTGNLSRKIFREPFLTPWLFDLELFARIIKEEGREKALEMMLEVPLEIWIHKGGSKLNFTSLIKTPVGLVKIYLKYHKFLS